MCEAFEGDEVLLMKWLDVMTSLEHTMNGMWLLLHHMRQAEGCVDDLSPIAQAKFDMLWLHELDDEVAGFAQRLASANRKHEYDYMRELLIAAPDSRHAELRDALVQLVADEAVWPSRCELFEHLGTAYHFEFLLLIRETLEARCAE